MKDAVNQKKEIETRTIVPEDKIEYTQNKLQEFGFISVESFLQKDTMLDRPDASLFKSGQKIRIREEKGKVELTYKGLFEGDQSFSRRSEVNIMLQPSQIEDLKLVFEALGYPFLFCIIKERKVYKKNNITATFDNWPIIGTLLEIEGIEDEVKEVVSFFDRDFLFSNTRLKNLFQNKVNETGKSFQELKDSYEKSSGNKLGRIELIIE